MAANAREYPVDGNVVIEASDLRKSFGPLVVLDGTDIKIAEGETRVVIGRSGCGKSVFLKHVIGLLKPDAGKVIVFGEDVPSLKTNEIYKLRERFGMVFQSSALFDSLSVGYNVGFFLYEYSDLPRSEIDDRVREALRKVGMESVEKKRPAELSGGMKKRVGFARAILHEPDIILYDEPTTGLDPITADVINELICYFDEELDVTSIVVTHDMVSAYKVGDTISMMYAGKVIQTGTPDEIKGTDNAFVRQFIEGLSEGPIDVIGGTG
ncbi:MAG: ABC transporter ATP-binding protein [Candidatus Coatesbacteria bacterium]|nr:MAG: ABC transporter ATP-binding protein [Candidatus Coatesbacteria bacterium]